MVGVHEWRPQSMGQAHSVQPAGCDYTRRVVPENAAVGTRPSQHGGVQRQAQLLPEVRWWPADGPWLEVFPGHPAPFVPVQELWRLLYGEDDREAGNNGGLMRHGWIRHFVKDFEENPRFQFKFHLAMMVFWI